MDQVRAAIADMPARLGRPAVPRAWRRSTGAPHRGGAPHAVGAGRPARRVPRRALTPRIPSSAPFVDTSGASGTQSAVSRRRHKWAWGRQGGAEPEDAPSGGIPQRGRGGPGCAMAAPRQLERAQVAHPDAAVRPESVSMISASDRSGSPSRYALVRHGGEDHHGDHDPASAPMPVRAHVVVGFVADGPAGTVRRLSCDHRAARRYAASRCHQLVATASAGSSSSIQFSPRSSLTPARRRAPTP